MRVGIVNTKAANFNSVLQGLKRQGLGDHEVVITDEVATLKGCDKIIMPGVGSASAVMAGLLGCPIEQVPALCKDESSATSELMDFVLKCQRPLLGICLGMQVQAQSSTEVPLDSGLDHIKTLGLVPGQVHKLQCGALPLPHMGWNTICHHGHPLFAGLPEGKDGHGAFVYFVHSYCLDVGAHTIATCNYGQDFSAAIARDNFMGVQFHPEKSGAVGAQILRNFLAL